MSPIITHEPARRLGNYGFPLGRWTSRGPQNRGYALPSACRGPMRAEKSRVAHTLLFMYAPPVRCHPERSEGSCSGPRCRENEKIRARFFAEFTLSQLQRFFASLRMTGEGLRMTGFSWFLGARQPTGMSDCFLHSIGATPPQDRLKARSRVSRLRAGAPACRTRCSLAFESAPIGASKSPP